MGIRLGDVQLRIMRVLWSKGAASAREITEEMAKSSPIAHSTVQTLLRQLEAKRAVTHTQEDRTFVFKPLIRESEVSRTAAQELLQKVFQGSISGLVSHLLASEEISEAEMARLRKIVADNRQGESK